MLILKKIKTDLLSKGVMQRVSAVQFDENSRGVELTLYAGHVAWEPPEGVEMAVSYRKPDGTSGLYDTLPDGTTKACSIAGNVITAIFAPQMLTVSGLVMASVILYSDTAQLATFQFCVVVEPNPSAGGGVSNDYYNYQSFAALNAAIGNLADLQTTAKGNLVEAINEAAKSGGSAGPSQNVDLGGYAKTEDLPEKLSDLENDLFYAGKRINLLTVTQADFSYQELGDLKGDGFLCPMLDLPENVEEDLHCDVTVEGMTVPDEFLLITYSETAGAYLIGNMIAFTNLPAYECFGIVLLQGLDSLGDFELTFYTYGESKKIASEHLDIAPLCIYNGNTLSGTYDGNEPVEIKIPATLKNPRYLLLTGAVSAAYDGSANVKVEIPAIPESLKNPQPLTINGISYDGSEAVEIVVNGGSVSDGETQTVLSDNLFDKTTVTTGQLFYHSSSGPQLTDSTDVCWAYVPLRGAGTYRTKVNYQEHQTYANRVPVLTEDKTFIQNVTGTVTETGNKYAADLEFTITEEMVANGAALYAFDCHTSILSTVMIVKDREYPSEYIPYGYIEVAVESNNVSDKHDNILRGKTAVFLGDSICAGTTVDADSGYYGYGWGGLIGSANKMIWTNYGRNGGTVTDLAAVAEERWLSTQADLAYAAHPDADYVIFEGGCNDADQMKDAGLGEISSDYSTFDTTTFSGAFESLILKILTDFPTAKVGYVIPQKMYAQNDHTATGHVHQRFFDRAIEICEKWGIPYVDLWKGNPLNPQLPTASQFYTDGQHLTLAGYQRITPQIEAFMRSL